MKRIRGLDAPTPGLARYLANAGPEASWQGFRRRNPGRSHELVEALTRLQHGLCGYCEIDLREEDRQIEHIVPRSDPIEGEERSLDATNMIACCRGGELAELSADEERFRTPRPENLSCGQAKRNTTSADFIDPRTLPALPSLLRVGYDGRIQADQAACEETEHSVDAVNWTIKTLGLNVERLRVARERHWRALEDSWLEHLDDLEVMEAAARGELLPQDDHRPPKFFTTSRSYFAPWGETILEEEPREWI